MPDPTTAREALTMALHWVSEQTYQAGMPATFVTHPLHREALAAIDAQVQVDDLAATIAACRAWMREVQRHIAEEMPHAT